MTLFGITKGKYQSLLLDIALIALLVLISLFLISFYLKAHYLNTGYDDWMIQAFRVKFLGEAGYSSWTHNWANGLSIWRSYQFLPHFITLGFSKAFQVDIPRAMVLLTIIQFVSIRAFIYLTLRALKFSPLTSFVCAVLSFAIYQYWQGVAEYSLLFAFTTFPIMLFFWVKFYQGKMKYFFPYVIGLSFYMHILLGVFSTVLWIVSIIFSRKKLLSFTHLSQLLIILFSSSIFWYPILSKPSNEYTSKLFSSKEFLNLFTANSSYFGLSLVLLLCLGLTAIGVLVPKLVTYRWSRILVIYSFILLILSILGAKVSLPSIINQTQLQRGVTMIGISIIFAVAPLLEHIRAMFKKSALFNGLIIFAVCLIFIDGLWITSLHSPPVEKGEFDEPVSRVFNSNKNINLLENRLWSSIPYLTNYYAPLELRYPTGYTTPFESKQIPLRLTGLIFYQPFSDQIPLSNFVRITDYFKLTGTKYIFIDEVSPFTKAFLEYEEPHYKDLGKIEAHRTLYHLFEYPNPLRNAALIDNKYKNKMVHFPFDLEITDANDQTELDDYVKKFVDVIYQPDNLPLTISYPTQESITVKIPDNRTSDMVYINESYDASWHAYLGQEKASIKPVGPNYMLVTLPSNKKGGLLLLKHTWPVSFYVSVYLIILIPFALLLIRLLQKIPALQAKKDEEEE